MTKHKYFAQFRDALPIAGVEMAVEAEEEHDRENAEGGVNDDFSYAFTVKRLIETGWLTYNGWSAPIIDSFSS